jgi:diacylglycerol kinase
MTEHRTNTDGQEAAFRTEHMAAYAMAVVALLLGAIGLLRGFGILGDDATEVGEPGTQAIGFPAVWDSSVWLLAAIAFGLLSWALHQSDHHRMRSSEHSSDAHEGAWKGEHLFAYIMAAATVVTALLGILTSFDVFDRGNDQPDGLPWLLASVLYGVVTNTLHNVRHHQMATEDNVARIVDQRMAGRTVTGRTTTEYGTETRP